MKLCDAFKSFPPDMILKSYLNGAEKTAAEWIKLVKDDPSEVEISDSKSNYGKVTHKLIYFPGIGPAYRECKYT
jgi:hypothetical protein